VPVDLNELVPVRQQESNRPPEVRYNGVNLHFYVLNRGQIGT
jgi:hypothetical protein